MNAAQLLALDRQLCVGSTVGTIIEPLLGFLDGAKILYELPSGPVPVSTTRLVDWPLAPLFIVGGIPHNGDQPRPDGDHGDHLAVDLNPRKKKKPFCRRAPSTIFIFSFQVGPTSAI